MDADGRVGLLLLAKKRSPGAGPLRFSFQHPARRPLSWLTAPAAPGAPSRGLGWPALGSRLW